MSEVPGGAVGRHLPARARPHSHSHSHGHGHGHSHSHDTLQGMPGNVIFTLAGAQIHFRILSGRKSGRKDKRQMMVSHCHTQGGRGVGEETGGRDSERGRRRWSRETERGRKEGRRRQGQRERDNSSTVLKNRAEGRAGASAAAVCCFSMTDAAPITLRPSLRASPPCALQCRVCYCGSSSHMGPHVLSRAVTREQPVCVSEPWGHVCQPTKLQSPVTARARGWGEEETGEKRTLSCPTRLPPVTLPPPLPPAHLYICLLVCFFQVSLSHFEPILSHHKIKRLSSLKQ